MLRNNARVYGVRARCCLLLIDAATRQRECRVLLLAPPPPCQRASRAMQRRAIAQRIRYAGTICASRQRAAERAAYASAYAMLSRERCAMSAFMIARHYAMLRCVDDDDTDGARYDMMRLRLPPTFYAASDVDV